MDNPGDFDPCECVWSHELATRRLINLIRQQQDYCTDSECLTDGPGGAGGDQSTAVFFIGFWFLIALVLFFLRPRSAVPNEKNRDQLGPNYDPPAPPPTI